MESSHSVRIDDGVVRLYKANGQFERVICAGALEAEIEHDKVVVRMQGGAKKIYSVLGYFIKCE